MGDARIPHAAVVLLAICCMFTSALAGPLLVEDNAGCLRSQEVEAVLSQVVVDHPGSDRLSITVVASPGEGVTISTLRAVSPIGEVVLDRTFEMNRSDCGNAAEIFATVLDAFLRTMPATAWDAPKSPPPKTETKTVTVERLVTQTTNLAYVAGAGRWWNRGADIELGLLYDVGSNRHRIATSGAVRITTPTDLGRGNYVEGYATLGVGWSYVPQGWMLRSEVRTGGLLAYGYGFDKSSRSWLPWLEGQVSVLMRWRRSLVGLQMSVSPLSHSIIASGAESTIPQFRLGLIWATPLFSSEKD